MQGGERQYGVIAMSGADALQQRKNELAAAIDANWRRQIAWLQTLVRFESLSGQEARCQTWLAGEFARRGWHVDSYVLAEQPTAHLPGHADCPLTDPAKAIQVVARVATANQSARGRSLILQGHVDVVPAGPVEMWSHAPFAAELDGDWLYGRGAQDMKTGIAAMVHALDAIADAGMVLQAPVYVETVTEEEISGRGALSTLARGYRADACLIPEPTGNMITRAHTGAIWFQLRMKGRPIHVQGTQTGTNVILSAFGLIQALQNLAARLNREAAADPFFGRVIEPIKFNVGVIRGGDWASSTPSWCNVDCRLGVLPGKPIEVAKDEVLTTIFETAEAAPIIAQHSPEVIWNGFQAEGSVLKSCEAEAVLNRAHCAVFGTEMLERISMAVDDTRFYNHYDSIPGLCYGPAGENLHGFDERASLRSLQETTLVLALFIAEWCDAK